MAFNAGIGIGAFMGGLQDGIKTARSIKQFKQEDEDRAYNLKKREVTDSRDAEDRSFQMGQRSRGLAEQARTDEEAATMRQVNKDGVAAAESARAQDAADGKDVKPFMDYYMQHSAPKIMQSYLSTGQQDKAKAFDGWIKTEGVQRGMRSFAGLVRAAKIGDADGFVKHFTDAYNNDQYFADGGKITGSRKITDKAGNTTGMAVTIRGQDGSDSERVFNGMDDIYKMGMELMEPSKVMEYGMKQLADRDAARLAAAKEGRVNTENDRRAARDQDYRLEAQNNQSLLREAEKTLAAKLKITPDVARKRLATIKDKLTEADPIIGGTKDASGKRTGGKKYSQMTPEEQTAVAGAALESEEGYIEQRDGKGMPAMPRRSPRFE